MHTSVPLRNFAPSVVRFAVITTDFTARRKEFATERKVISRNETPKD
jgi:hypothetical protein